jgi:hypothetical protein
MQWFNLAGQKFENDEHITIPEPEEVEVLPLHGIPVECEDAPVHDGTWPCGDPDCPCAIYGYGIPSLD